MIRTTRVRGSLLLAASILLVWSASAYLLGQSPLAAQKSGSLLELGAVDGDVLMTGEWWRLLTSQFLHVHLLHMLFNALCIGLVGGCIERRFGWWRTCLIYFVGGTTGQAASVTAYPTLVSSGASQGLMALCGAAIVLPLRVRARGLVLVVIAIQGALDLYAAHTIKAGHAAGFIAGLTLGMLLSLVRSQPAASR